MHAEKHIKSLLETHEAIAAVSTALYQASNNASLDPDLLKHVETLKSVSIDHPAKTVSKLCSVVQCNIEDAHRFGGDLAPEQKSRLLEHCEELRLRIIADALWLNNSNDSQTGDLVLDIENPYNLDSKVSSICRTPTKITHASVGTTRVILMPSLDSLSDYHAIYDELMEIYESKPEVETWVLDLSLLTTVPLLLLANLVAYAGRLRQQGDDLHICWLRDGILPAVQMERLRGIFKLQRIGKHYFSCKTKSAESPL